MASQVASLMIDIAADVAKVRKDFDAVGKEVQGFGRVVSNVGNLVKGFAAAFSLQEIVSFGESILANVDAMEDLAENLKIPTGEFQALRNAALLAGQEVESTGNAIAKFNQFLGKAESGGKEQIEFLNELGVYINNLDGTAKSTSQRLREVALAITSIENPAKRADAEVKAFGKSGQQVSATLEQWKRPLDEVNAELEAMGLNHSPEVRKAIGEMAAATDKASQQIEVLFGYFYAMAKSGAMTAVASVLTSIANAINSIKLGSVDGLTKLLMALGAAGTGNLAVASNILSSVDAPVAALDKQIAAAEKQLKEANERRDRYAAGGERFATLLQEETQAVTEAQEQLAQLQAKKAQFLPPLKVEGDDKPKPGSNPKVTGGGGTDKFAEALRRIKDETDALVVAQQAYNDAFAQGIPTREAEQLAKHLETIGTKQASMIKGLTGEQAEQIRPMVERLEKMRYAFEQSKQAQRDADQISRQYGDGQKQLVETLRLLDELEQRRLLTTEELAIATDEANRRYEEQRLIFKGQGEGIEQLTAGWEYASMKMGESLSSFNVGQALFTQSFQTMSGAIDEFVETGVADFPKLTSAFAKMLGQMAAQMLIHKGLSWLFSAGKPLTGIDAEIADWSSYGSSGGGLFGWLFGGGRASGGPVTPGFGYTVGEQGPERFVPTVPGRIEAAGSGSGGDVTVNIDMKGTAVSSGANGSQGVDFARRIKGAVQQVIQAEKRPGGLLWTT